MGRHGDADARADDDTMPLDLVGLGDDLEQALGELRGDLALISGRDVQDREFVAAEAGDRVALTDQALQSRRHRLEQRVADRMPERIVDRLEQVEIEDENRVSDAGRLVAFERGVRLLAKQHPIGEIGQGIVARQVGDARLATLPLGDVVVRRHPAAACHRLVGHLDDAPVGEFMNDIDCLAVCQPGAQLVGELLRVVGEISGALLLLEHIDELGTGLGRIGEHPVDTQIAFVAHKEPLILVEHAQALRHVVERRIHLGMGAGKLPRLFAQLALAVRQRSLGGGEIVELEPQSPQQEDKADQRQQRSARHHRSEPLPGRHDDRFELACVDHERITRYDADPDEARLMVPLIGRAVGATALGEGRVPG